ncbi:polysaccharide deacetylase family protein [Pseudogracilibacillus auburnensis]|uniref:polysaccharide deacetylase family protein n=1 Tax=Pseudogracilibacillus auburnensis TaxID=1494959 RepID=UPI001A971BB6|nr:polysaccharide deacetylase family protein [Pseudogracilibacillus auburnensis]MBO1003954.1 polysaccharide deacetylase family protein [Pseudogracilibacillus auburnensis]
MSETEKLLIIHADDFGMCHATNQAIIQLMNEGAISSTTLMVNCPWSLEAAKAATNNSTFDVGVHLTLTSEWDHYKWGPVNKNGNVHTLVDELGHFPANLEKVAQADREQVREEIIVQIETAIKMGIDPTHLDSHMGAYLFFMDLHIEVAAQYNLPLRFTKNPPPGYHLEQFEKMVQLANRKGIIYPDYIMALPFIFEHEITYEESKQNAIRLLKDVKPGVTELLFHPSLESEELKGITDTWQARQFEFDLFRDEEVKAVIQAEGLKVIGWRELRDIQRKEKLEDK